MNLDGKCLLITGALTHRSYRVLGGRAGPAAPAPRWVLTGFGRGKRLTERAAKRLPEPAEVLELDVNSPDDLRGPAGGPRVALGAVDGVLHAIAFAPPSRWAAGSSRRSRRRRHGVHHQRVQAEGGGGRAGPAPQGGGLQVVGLDFDATVAWPAYDWMGVSKACLERWPATWPATSGPTACG